MTSTRRPCAPAAPASISVSDVLPTPPFWFSTATVSMSYPAGVESCRNGGLAVCRKGVIAAAWRENGQARVPGEEQAVSAAEETAESLVDVWVEEVRRLVPEVRAVRRSTTG